MSFAESLIMMFVQPILSLIIFIFLAYVVISWLFILKIVKPNNPTARQVYGILASVVEPIVSPFRKIIPPLGNFDMGFFFAFMVIYWTKYYVIPSLILPMLR